MNHFVWSNSLLLGAMLFVLGGLKFVGFSTSSCRRGGVGVVALAAVFVLAVSGKYFDRDEPILAALALLIVGSAWWLTLPLKRPS